MTRLGRFYQRGTEQLQNQIVRNEQINERTGTKIRLQP